MKETAMSTQHEDKIDLDRLLERGTKMEEWFISAGMIMSAANMRSFIALARKAQEPDQRDEEILALHRQLAAEKLRADQGWQRAEVKSRECLDLRERMAAQKPAIPEGWVIAPAEATPEMCEAGQNSGKNCAWSYARCYRAMLAAAGVAPQEPAVKAGWISVDDELPEDDTCVMAAIYPYNNEENEKIAVQAHYFDGTFMNHEGDDLHPPTHWMNMPKIPAKETTHV